MTDLEKDILKKEVRGMNTRTLLWLIGGIITIEATILLNYNSIKTKIDFHDSEIIKIEKRQDKFDNNQIGIDKRVYILENEHHHNFK